MTSSMMVGPFAGDSSSNLVEFGMEEEDFEEEDDEEEEIPIVDDGTEEPETPEAAEPKADL